MSLLLSVLFLLPVIAAEPEPFIAVYCTDAFVTDYWDCHPNYLCVSSSWNQFDYFLDSVVKLANTDNVVIDIACHGSGRSGCLYLSSEYNIWDEPASLGFILNHIEEKLPGRHITVLLEACHAGLVYRKTLRHNRRPGLYIENHPRTPRYPVYGSTLNSISRDSLMYCQYKSGFHIYWIDLRKAGRIPNQDPELIQEIRADSMNSYIVLLHKFYPRI